MLLFVEGKGARLQNHALPRFPILVALFGEEGRASCMLKDFSDSLATLGAAFEVVPCADFLLDFLALGKGQKCWKIGGRTAEIQNQVAGSSKLFERVLHKMIQGRGGRTCSGVTGFCDVLCNSSIVLES